MAAVGTAGWQLGRVSLVFCIKAVLSKSACRPPSCRRLRHTTATALHRYSNPNVYPIPPGYQFYPHHNDIPITQNQQAFIPPHTSPMSIYESDYTVLPLPNSSIFHYLFPERPGESPLSQSLLDPAAIAYIDGLDGRTVTRGQVEDQALKLGSGLRSLGMKRGDVSCIFGVNSLEWANAAFGCQAAGLRVSPANYAYAPKELAHQINDSGASLIFVDPALLPVLDSARAHLKSPLADDRVILLCPPDRKPKGSHFQAISELWRRRESAERFDGGAEKEVAWLCYSSGTTGLPKGVMTSHHNLTSQLQALAPAYQPLSRDTSDVLLGILPFSHIYGLTIVLHQPLTVGVPVVVLPRFEELAVLRAIEKYKITFGLVVPPVLLVLVHSANTPRFNLNSLRGLQSGAAPLSSDLCAAFEKRYPQCKVTQGYGLTETSPVVSVMTTAESEGRKGSIGRLLPTYQARLVVPETGEDAVAGSPGELWVRGPSVMRGYHGNDAATAKTFAPGGWFMTGDVAVRDDKGYYTIVDRVKELIKFKGFQVPPAELEALLLTHPKVVDAGVIGIWDETQATELPRAYVVAATDVAKTTEERAALSKEIAAWVSGRVARHKRLHGGVFIIDAIPKSPSGKILRKELRARAGREREQKKPQLKAKL